jgi:hypothetical protein
MLNGENVVTGFSKLSRNIHVRNMVIRAFVVSISRMLKNLMICQGILFSPFSLSFSYIRVNPICLVGF